MGPRVPAANEFSTIACGTAAVPRRIANLLPERRDSFFRRGKPCCFRYGVDALEGVLPTIVVLGRDDRILWEDRRTRCLHSIDALAGNLNAAIVRAIEQQSAVSGGPGKQESYSAARAGG